MTERKRTKELERAHTALLDQLAELKALEQIRILKKEGRDDELKAEMMPRHWRTIEREVPVRPKRIRVTAGYDEDVVRWYRSMGMGYQARMNAVLRAYMLAMRSREIPSEKNVDWKGHEI